MKLDRTTYEAWLLDRMEGRLSREQEAGLNAFLLAHPDLDGGEGPLPMIGRDEAAFPHKHALHRHLPPQGLPDAHTLVDFLIAQQEGDLDGAQRTALERMVKGNPHAEREQRMVAAARIRPEPVAYAWKEGLKKREARTIALWPRLAAAASILLLLGAGAWWLYQRPGEHAVAARAEQPAPGKAEPAMAEKEKEGADPTRVPAEAVPATPPRRAGTPPHPQAAHPPKAPLRTEPDQEHLQPLAHEALPPGPEPTRPSEPGAAVAAESAAPAPVVAEAPAPAEPRALTASAQGQPIGVVAANAVRTELLTAPARPAGLDVNDAVALADRAVAAVTGGRGGVALERVPGRRRFQLRLGRDLGIAASIGQ